MQAPGKNVKMIPVESSNMVSVGYDDKTSTLYIRFKSGLYGYAQVTKAAFEGLCNAESKGKHFNAMGIKARGVKIPE